MAYQAPYSGLAQLMEMQGRGPDTRLVHMTPMELRTLQAMSPTGRLTTNPETGLPEAGILEDILPIALPIAGSFLFPMAAPAIFGAGSALATPAIAGAIGTGLGSAASGLLQGKGLGDSLIQGGLSGLMSYGLGELSGVFAPSGGITSAPSATTADVAGAGLMGGFDPATAAAEATQLTAAQEAAKAAAQPPGFFERLAEPLTKTIAPDTLGGATYGSALGSGLSGIVSSGLTTPPPEFESPYELAYDDYYDADLEGGRARGRARARTLNMPPAYASPSELMQMATTRGFGTFLAANGGQVPNPYGEPYGPGDPYGGTMETDQTDGFQPTVGTGIIGNMSVTEPIDMGLGMLNPSPLSLGLGLVGLATGIPGLGLIGSMIGPPNVNALGQVQAYGTGNQSFDQFGNVQGTTTADMASMSAAPATVGVTPGLQDPMGVYGGFTSTGAGSGSYADVADDTYGESTPDMGSFDDGGGDVGGDVGGVGGDVGDDWSDIRLKRGVQYLGDVSGLRKYSWNYVWGGPRKVGVMAHELLGTKYADAVRVVDGYMRVDYSQLPVEVRTI